MPPQKKNEQKPQTNNNKPQKRQQNARPQNGQKSKVQKQKNQKEVGQKKNNETEEDEYKFDSPENLENLGTENNQTGGIITTSNKGNGEYKDLPKKQGLAIKTGNDFDENKNESTPYENEFDNFDQDYKTPTDLKETSNNDIPQRQTSSNKENNVEKESHPQEEDECKL